MRKNDHPFIIKFWGVRGSHPVPSEVTNRYGGNTPCVEIRAGEHIIIFDAGTGIIGLGRELSHQARTSDHPVIATICFSHLHHDHTQGLPFFAPLYASTTKLNFIVPDMYAQNPQKVLSEVMSSPIFPVSFQQTGADKQFHNICQTQLVVLNEEGCVMLHSLNDKLPENAVIIRSMRSHAHPQGVMIYRVEYQSKSVVYATDTECYVGGDQRLVAFARGVDLLIHDAQYTEDHYIGALAGASVTQGYGHSTTAMACGTAQAAQVGQLVLFHHDPNYTDQTIDDLEREARDLFTNTVAAREGQIVQLAEVQSPARSKNTPALLNANQENRISLTG